MFEGPGHFFKAEILSGSVCTPLSLTMWPRYCTWVLKNSHLEPLSFKPWRSSFLNIFSRRSKWSSNVLLKMIISSQ